MSSSETRGFERTLSNSSSLRVIGNCWMLNESAPAWLRIACFTDAFRPWISDTTAMIDVTATMLPSTVMNDRSFAPQIALRAIFADSRNLCMPWIGDLAAVVLLVVDLDRVAVGNVADGIVRSGDHLIARFEAKQDLEILVAGDAHLERHELDFLFLVADDEDAFGFLARLAGFQFGRRVRGGRAVAPAPLGIHRLLHDL